MKKILAILFHPIWLAFLGLLALALIVWFFGPLIAIAEWRPLELVWPRLTLIAVIVLFYVGKKLYGAYKARLANAKMTQGLLATAEDRAQPEVSASRQEIETLRKRLAEALGKLKHARVGSAGKASGLGALFAKRNYLYQLPWYIFIGAPGSGKTTALINSGLEFPLAEGLGKGSVRGVGGTRNCDWWFTDEAVLLDTAGRYATQDSNREVDATAWRGFLQLLKKNRPRRPINGVILTISVLDLMRQSRDERMRHAVALRTRIQELYEALNIRFPIYVLVTKCDLLAGFMEFVAEFGKDERAQVWGTTLPLRDASAETDPLTGFSAELMTLERRLNDRLIDRMQHERDLQQRALIYSFPQQFAALKALLIGFLSTVFTASRFHETVMLRGVYFTSGTQEGSPIDRVVGTLARSLGMENKILPPQAASGRSYFLTRLLKEVIFAEQGLAGTNLKWERRRALVQLGGLALIGIFTLGSALAWYMSYRNNNAYVAAVGGKLAVVKNQVESVPTGATTNVVTLLPVLKSVQDLSAASGAGGSAPLMMSFGLFQGDKLSSASTNAYRRLLRDTFMQRLVYRVEEQLRSDGTGNVELLYENLKAYLMLFDAKHFDRAAVKAWIITDWEQTLPREVSVDQRRALEGHLDALFANGQVAPPLPADERLVRQVRAQLAALPLAHRIYSRLKRQGVGSDIPEFKISQAAGPAAALVFERSSGQPLTKGVPGLFTYEGYHTAFLREADRVTKQLADEESWVLGVADRQKSRFADAAAVENLTDEVRGLYLRDYANIWEKFIDDIKLVRSDSLQKSIELARILSSSSSSPLPLLMRALVKETTLGETAAEEKTLVGKASEKVKQSRESLLRIIGGSQRAQSRTAPGKTLESIVDDRFDGLRRMVRAPAGQTPPIETSLALINELYTLLTATDTAVKGGAAPPRSDVPTKIKAEAARMPEPLRSMMQVLSTAGSTQALGAMRSNLSASLTATVGDFCPKAINDRYPFVRSSARDVTQEDFGRLFAPGGLIDDFFQKNLRPYVDTSTRPWSFKRVGDASLGNSATLAQFQHAAVIRDVFFRGGGSTVSLRLDFKAMEMDASINQFILDVDGQLVKYSHGPQVPQAVQWPGPKGSTQVRMQVQPPSATGVSGRVFEGPWALFRMFDRLRIENSPQPEKFRVTFDIEGRKAVFEVTASSVQNPFRLKEFEQFRCPNKL